MKLHLRYNSTIHHPAAAAFIRGTHPLIWLREINLWNLPVDELECYIIPVSIESLEPAGLFVIFNDAAKVKNIDLLEAYSCLEKKLYFPVNSELLPQVGKEELRSLLLWEKQVLHPAIGFIGFEKKDRVDLSGLFLYDEADDTDWSFAHPGLPVRPGFHQIQIVQPTAEELIKSIKDDIGQKPLDEIPIDPKEERSVVEKIRDDIKFGLLKGILSASSIVGKIFPQGNVFNTSNRTGIFQKLQNWLERNLEELEKKRNDEIKRLLKLFDENNDEALQYAIPLDSPYLNRGSKTSSASLARRHLQFNLDKLGGGQVVDAWDVSDYYSELRAKYLKAAQREIEQKNFKKAAYVYAHLLGDYPSAANVLEQGGMYREAAALYKDHLKNISSAAECLERGKLYNEAIELYKTLGRNEKIGDLYMTIQQEEKGEEYYEKYISERLSFNDCMDASRVMDEKLNQTGRAKQTLLDGWKGHHLAETCLKGYFDIVLKKENDTTEKAVKEVFTKHTPKHKRVPFLNILEYVSKKKNETGLITTVQEIAYEIVYSETESGNVAALNSLKKFLPGDRLIGSDVSRYAGSVRLKPAQSRTPQIFHLDQSIKWVKATWHRNQFLAVGIKNGFLQMVRGNWYTNLEYYSWSNPVKSTTRFLFINAPYYSNTILLHSSDDLPITRKNLPKNKYFNEALVVFCPPWMHKGTSQCIINEEKNICRLDIADGSMTLHHYNMEGELKKSINCVFEKDQPAWGYIASHPHMANHDGYYYTYKDKQFITISEAGLAKSFDFNTIIRFFTASHSFKEFYLLISTNKGCLLYKPTDGNLNMQGGFFGETLIPSVISFISSNLFVVAEKKKAFLFEIINDVPKEIMQFETHNPIVAVLPTSDRFKFALLEESGRITMCETEGTE